LKEERNMNIASNEGTNNNKIWSVKKITPGTTNLRLVPELIYPKTFIGTNFNLNLYIKKKFHYKTYQDFGLWHLKG
jgi:hypothetical protein